MFGCTYVVVLICCFGITLSFKDELLFTLKAEYLFLFICKLRFTIVFFDWCVVMEKVHLVLVLVFGFFVWGYYGQVPIPTRQDGFWYEERFAEVDSVLIEAFFDPVCPDSRDSWPPLKQALSHYASRVSLVVHPFPLPYHDNAFVCSRALHVVNRLNSSATFHLLESFFHHQEGFYGKATFNLSKASVVEKVAKFAGKAVGGSLYTQLKSGLNDTKTDHSTRISFKYGCVKGVYGTPFFFVNGFPLPDDGSTLDYKKWRAIIDPLMFA